MTKFIGKMCLLLKTLADRKTSGSATLGTTNGQFCPEDEIAGDHVDSEKKTLHPAAFQSFKSRTYL